MIPKFNPGFQSDQEAVDHFVVRRPQFDSIMSLLRAGQEKEAGPHILVSAPRGAGKTTLCRRVVAEVRLSPQLSGYWQPVFLGEESYSVTSPGEFLLEVLLQLNDQLSDSSLDTDLRFARAADRENVLISRCLEALTNCSNVIARRLLVVVENFHIILADQIQGGEESSQTLLEILQNEIFGVIATSVTKAIDGAENMLPANYTPVELAPLTVAECRDLWRFLTHDDVLEEKIRPIHILTGGSPRLLHILADFMRTRSLRDLMENLNFLIDQNTEYFKSQLDLLPAIERKVFAALLEIWDPSSAKQVAEAARVTTNVASAMLARLSERGAVVKEPGQGRTVLYAAAERLFNIYYLMRRRNHPSARVKALVAFMVDFYSQEELVDTATLLVREACDVEPSHRGDYHSTFDAIMARSSDSARAQILSSTPTEFILSFRQDQRESRNATYLPEGLAESNSDGRLNNLIDQIEAAADDGQIEEALKLIKEAIELDPDMAELWIRLAFVENELGRSDEAVVAARRATVLDPKDPWTFTVLALALGQNDQPDEAEEAYRAALKVDPGHEPALTSLAALLEQRGQPAEAVSLYNRALADGVLTDLARAAYAQLLSRMERPKESEAILRGAAEDFENVLSRRALVEFLHSHDRSEEAQRLLENFAEREERWQSFADLGALFLRQARNGPAARDALRTAIDTGGKGPLLYSLLARAMRLAGHTTDEVTAVTIDMLSKFGESATAWTLAGFIYQDLDNEVEAEVAYRSALERNDGEHARLLLARLLERDPRRHGEVEELLRTAIATQSGRQKCVPMRQLAEFLIHKGEDDAAKSVLEEAVKANKRCSCCLVLHGDVCRRAGEFKGAEAGYRAALDLYDGDVGALTGLAQLVVKHEAAGLIEKALLASPDDPRALLAQIQLQAGEKASQKAAAERLLAGSPDFIEGRLFLAAKEAELGNLAGAVEQLSLSLEDLPTRREFVPSFVRTVMAIAEQGGGSMISDLLASHRNRESIEPLAVAIRIAGGERPVVAKEVLEVARDIVSRSSKGAT